MDQRLHEVHEEEHRHERENQSGHVSGKTDVKDTISLVRCERLPPHSVIGLCSEGSLLLSQAWDVLVDSHVELGLSLVLLEHSDNLVLFLIYS